MAQKSLEANIGKLLIQKQLDRVEIVVRGEHSGVRAIAYPARYNPVVNERREQGIQRVADALERELTLAEAEAVVNHAHEDPIAQGAGQTIEDAVNNLALMMR